MRYRINLLGTWVDPIDIQDAGARVADFVRSRKPHQIVPANVDFLRIAREDARFQELVNSADLVIADGMPLVWAARRAGHSMPQRISGVEMTLVCAGVAAAHGFSIFLLGASPGVAEETAQVLQARFPDLRIAGTYAPPPLPLSPQEQERTERIIREARPDILLVAFGAPLQERWIRAYQDRLGVPLSMGVGGAFDMLAGRVRRAPIWMQRAGLEWSYRLIQEPGRLWRRYFIQDLPIFVRLMLQARRERLRARPVGPVLLVEEVVPELARREESSARVG